MLLLFNYFTGGGYNPLPTTIGHSTLTTYVKLRNSQNLSTRVYNIFFRDA